MEKLYLTINDGDSNLASCYKRQQLGYYIGKNALGEIDNNQCNICQTPYTYKDYSNKYKLSFLKCGHLFHSLCLMNNSDDRYSNHSDSDLCWSSCPICQEKYHIIDEKYSYNLDKLNKYGNFFLDYKPNYVLDNYIIDPLLNKWYKLFNDIYE